jgi:hypothetical protein
VLVANVSEAATLLISHSLLKTLQVMQPQPALDFRKPGVHEYALVASEKHENHENPNFDISGRPKINRQFWLEFLVYVLVIFVLVLFQLGVVRIFDETHAPVTELRDAARFLFPHLNNDRNNAFSPTRNTSALHIKGREDIQSFAFDLGGSTCACLLQWDLQQYWQRVFYGTKYIVFHCTTSFFGVLCLHRPQWVLTWKIINEVIEELGNGIAGRWAWTVSVQNVESRYDTLINDMLLAYVPFSVLAMHVLKVLDLPDPIPHPTSIDKAYLLQFLRVFAQYIMFNQANQTNETLGNKKWTLGQYECKLGHLFACSMQTAVIWLLVLLHKLSSQQARVISVCICLLWAPFAVHRVDNAFPADEQIDAILSFSLAGLFLCCYQFYRGSRGLLFWLRFFFPLCVYLTTLSIWFFFNSIVSAPSERFYYNSRWCGLAANKAGPAPPYSCTSS